ncbi:AMP-binding protein [Streptomyces sp. 4F14]|uniref:AMP-binding protein n=1 Tax=Streptomyces sp. 4F14 TaxID=3394380 RepID=UPI003A8873A9
MLSTKTCSAVRAIGDPLRSSARIFEAIRQKVLDCVAGGTDPRPDFSWPDLAEFNWATDWFDPTTRGNLDPAVIWSERGGAVQKLTFDGLRENSDRAAGWLVRQGVGHGTRILVALDACAALWEIQLAALKLGAVVVPVPAGARSGELLEVTAFSGATALVIDAELAQEVRPAAAWTGITVGGRVPGWSPYEDAYGHALRHRGQSPRNSLTPFLLEHSMTGVGSGRLHSHYACTVGRLTDLFFTQLSPGKRYVTAAPAGSVEHLCFSFLGPLTAGATTFVASGPDAGSTAAVQEWAGRENARLAYVPVELLGENSSSYPAAVSSGPSSAVQLLSSVSAEALARADGAGGGAGLATTLSALPQEVRWGVRHRHTSVGLMASPVREAAGSKLRATALPGHSLHVVAPARPAPSVHSGALVRDAQFEETGEVWIDVHKWPWPESGTSTCGPRAVATTSSGTGSLRTGLFGRRHSDGTVALLFARSPK